MIPELSFMREGKDVDIRESCFVCSQTKRLFGLNYCDLCLDVVTESVGSSYTCDNLATLFLEDRLSVCKLCTSSFVDFIRYV